MLSEIDNLCNEQRSRFRWTYPKGLEVTKENIALAMNDGFSALYFAAVVSGAPAGFMMRIAAIENKARDLRFEAAEHFSRENVHNIAEVFSLNKHERIADKCHQRLARIYGVLQAMKIDMIYNALLASEQLQSLDEKFNKS
jgi:hypothetical protein